MREKVKPAENCDHVLSQGPSCLPACRFEPAAVFRPPDKPRAPPNRTSRTGWRRPSPRAYNSPGSKTIGIDGHEDRAIKQVRRMMATGQGFLCAASDYFCPKHLVFIRHKGRARGVCACSISKVQRIEKLEEVCVVEEGRRTMYKHDLLRVSFVCRCTGPLLSSSDRQGRERAARVDNRAQKSRAQYHKALLAKGLEKNSHETGTVPEARISCFSPSFFPIATRTRIIHNHHERPRTPYSPPSTAPARRG